MRITIIGAGIGGLTLGIALQAKGFQVDIFEKSKAFQKIGAGIILGNNAMQVYNQLGLTATLKAKGSKVSSMNVTNASNKLISGMSLEHFENKFDSINLAIHRADLQNSLFEALAPGTVQFSKAVKNVHENDDSVRIEFEDGSSIDSSLVIAADGVHSVVRNGLFPKVETRDSKQLCWRAVVEHKLSSDFDEIFTEMWGKGRRVGFGQINEKEVYWFALINSDKDHPSYHDGTWRKKFSEFIPEVQEILGKADPDRMHLSQMSDFKPIKKWYTNRVCLLGDAAHAMTPNMGQGAGQSIEDAYRLAQIMTGKEFEDNQHSFDQLFKEYQEYRMPKVKRIVNTSWTIGSIAQLNNPLLRGFRNNMMRLLPDSLNQKQLESVFTI
ncbi:FAD-dependent monooxygenase [Saprospiraceae bacterium]|nr:FAD-dependent monooxygenase [Saprospiraceae bacterium]